MEMEGISTGSTLRCKREKTTNKDTLDIAHEADQTSAC